MILSRSSQLFPFIFLALIVFVFGVFIPHIVLAATGEPNSPTVAVNDSSTGAGTISWSTITAPFSVDGTNSVSVSLGSNKTTKYIKFTGFNFSIPAGTTIDGITVTVARRTTVTNVVKDSVVELVTTSATTTSKADTSVFWPTTFGSKSYGGSADTWGRAWTPTEINSGTFGLIISAQNFDAASSRTVHIDGVTITVAYTIPVVTHTLTYTAGSNGSITGTASQTVNDGANGTAVTAVADTGFHFLNWSDTQASNPRTDSNVTGDVTAIANFEADAPPETETDTTTPVVTVVDTTPVVQVVAPVIPSSSSGGHGGRHRSQQAGVSAVPTAEETVAAIVVTATPAEIETQIATLSEQVLTLMRELVVSLQAQRGVAHS